MNILCCDQFSSVGGGQRCLLDLLPAFTSRGWKPCVVLPNEGELADAIESIGVPVEYVSIGGYRSGRKPFSDMLRFLWRSQACCRRLNEIAAKWGADLIYVNGSRMLPAAAWVAVRQQVPLVFHCHNRLRQRAAIAMAGVSLLAADAFVISCCEYAAEPIKAYIKRQRFSVVYNGVAMVDPGLRPGRAKIRRIGVVGRVEQEKGQLEFVRAARLLANCFPEVRFVIVGAPMFTGSSYCDRVRKEAQGLPITFSGWQHDLRAVFFDLDLLVVPSNSIEATTRVILEAYSAGVPVVAYASGGIPEVIQDGRTGFLAYEHSPESLAHRIADVIRMSPDDLLAVVLEAQHIWKSRYTLARFQEQICRVIADSPLRHRAAAA